MTFIGPAPTPADLGGVRYLFTDIDDTLTTEGRLLPETYGALWELSRAGITIVPVTGGSAGWCEHIVRAWPVAAVIGESGAFAVSKKAGEVVFDYWEGGAIQADRQSRHLAAIKVLLKATTFRIAHDQPFRLADVAIDIAGHSHAEIDRLADNIRALGGTVAISSIHINTWIGTYDKRSMSERLLTQLFTVDQSGAPAVTAFVGDSRNDAPMFGYIRNSFGVGNIVPILPQLPVAPRWVATRHAGLGFADIARTILAAQAK
jgi:HAD superfamily hydrolase (TIGR01484 family)